MPARTPVLISVLLLLSCGGDEETPVAPPPPPPPPPLEPNELPTAAFTVDVDLGQAPLAVNFDASSSSDPDGTLVSHTWSFGDGGTATGVRVAHTYAEAGVYEIELTVRDDRDGEDSATGSVTAFTPPGSGPNRIHGTIWQDRNMDEAMDEDERVLEGFGVFLDMDGDGSIRQRRAAHLLGSRRHVRVRRPGRRPRLHGVANPAVRLDQHLCGTVGACR